MLVIGLTGGIATGKSTVSQQFRTKGIPVVDCDEIAHQITRKVVRTFIYSSGDFGFMAGQLLTDCVLLQSHAGYKRVLKAFGPSILRADGEIDRDVLGKLVFENASARKKLNKATHPAVTLELAKQLFLSLIHCKRVVVSLPMHMPGSLLTQQQHCCRPLIGLTAHHTYFVPLGASAPQVIDMPLLFETGAYLLTWPRVLVAADPATQV